LCVKRRLGYPLCVLAPTPRHGRWSALPKWTVASLLVALVVAAYASSFRGMLVFDDLPAIVENASIQHGTSLGQWLRPPMHSTVAGRPVLNLSLALNQLVSGDAVWSYHALNLLIHLASGACLFGIVRRTLERIEQRRGRSKFICDSRTSDVANKFASTGKLASPKLDSSAVAAAITVLWLVHPLQTESVTYVVQRAESLSGLLYLAAFYVFIRTTGSQKPVGWGFLTVILAALGMATKESVVTLPVMLLLYDRVFVSRSVLAALRERWPAYLGLMAGWAVLAYLMLHNPGRGGSAGLGTGVAPIEYALTQLYAVVRYLRLAVFPQSLVFDYGSVLIPVSTSLITHAVIYVGLLIATAQLLILRPKIGFLGAAFFLLLAPTSTFVPVASQTMAEHRMYLTLAAPIAGVVLAAHAWIGQRMFSVVVVGIVALSAVTFQRNHVYQSAHALWSDTATKWPRNARAHDWLGNAAFAGNHLDEAMAECGIAVSLQPNEAKFHNNYGAALASSGHFPEAAAQFQQALDVDPRFRDARHNLAQAETRWSMALLQSGHTEDAVAHLRHAVTVEPEDPALSYNLEFTLRQLGGAQR
jgi:protein O-mannosyl-transferase